MYLLYKEAKKLTKGANLPQSSANLEIIFEDAMILTYQDKYDMSKTTLKHKFSINSLNT